VPILFVIPVAIFVCCGLTQFWFHRRIRRALIERHSDLYLAISHKAFFADAALTRFAFSRRARDLDDPILSSAVGQYRLLLWVGFAAWIAVAGLLVTGLAFWPIVR
jgi:hypothetical protein